MKALLLLILLAVPCAANDLLSDCIAVAVAKAGARPATLEQRAVLMSPASTDNDRRIASMKLQAIQNAAVADGKLEYMRIMAMRSEILRQHAEEDLRRQMFYTPYRRP